MLQKIMDNATYRHLFSKIKKSAALPHHNYPCHNLHSIRNLTEVSHSLNSDAPELEPRFFTSFPCYQQFPYVVYRNFPFFCGSGDTDEAIQLVKRKSKWQKDLNNLQIINIEKAIQQVKDLSQNKVVKVTHNLKKHISHFHADPEPVFQGKYNWLYTGGTLSCIEDRDGSLLISSDFFGKKPGFNVLKLNESLDAVELKFTSTLKRFSPIHQITCQTERENLFICVRQKNISTLFSVRGRDGLTQPRKVWCKKVASPKLITSVDIKPSCEQVLIADTNHDLHVFDVETAKKVFGLVGRRIGRDSVRDCWSQTGFGDHGVYLALRNCFVVLDPRDVNSKTKLDYSPTPAVNNCEDICSFVKSSIDSNYVYLGTTHAVLQVDLRNGETVQKWTHLMKRPLQFLTSTANGAAEEVLVLQSEDVDELSGITNESVKDGDQVNFLSRSLPRLLNNTKESLRVARFHSACLSPSIAERISFVVTGMQCVKNRTGNLAIYTSNSAGDIFLSKMEKKGENRFPGEEDEEVVVNAMKMYESHVEQISVQRSAGLELELTDMSGVLEDLKRPSQMRKRRRSCELSWKYHEMFAPESLGFCRDLLAPKFLKVWNYSSVDSEFCESAMTVEEKVREWMHRS